jgi:muconolactone delta-isomerase
MKFLAITRRRVERFSDAEFAVALPPEAVRARELYAEGAFRELYSRGDVPGAVIILEAADVAEAEKIVGSLPMAQQAMMDVEVIPLGPYRGFVGG